MLQARHFNSTLKGIAMNSLKRGPSEGNPVGNYYIFNSNMKNLPKGVHAASARKKSWQKYFQRKCSYQNESETSGTKTQLPL